jgi:hypothetical protein
MAKRIRSSWVSRILRLVPSRLLAALDAWSYRVALERAAQRRLAATRQLGAPAATQYKLEPLGD